MQPLLAAWASTLGLIFGGCCSNVFALEAIVKEEPSSGLLVTFTQFIVVAVFTLPSQISKQHPPYYLKPLAVPIRRWAPNILMFFIVNLMNNIAFGYKISVPVHIILRSGGSILTMIVGFIAGKRYSRIQVLSICGLTIGIIIAAMADAEAKGKMSSSGEAINLNREVITGLVILFVAQLISAIMGLYVQLTYQKYGSHWLENLFYSHLLSIPLFAPFTAELHGQYHKLKLSATSASPTAPAYPRKNLSRDGAKNLTLLPIFPTTFSALQVPPLLQTLIINALTQYVCIRGVNLLAAQTSALGVTIVLNVRKLVSLFISIWWFGNELPPGVAVGAAIVFGSAGLYGWESGRVARREKLAKEKKSQ